MATFGVRLYNNQNLLVADENVVNYTLRSAGQISDANFSTGDFNNPISTMGLPMPGFNCPLIFFRPITPGNAGPRVATIPNETDSDFTSGNYTMSQGVSLAKVYDKTIGTLQYYVFDRWTPPERSDWGLRISNASGAVVFDSGWNFLKLRKVIWLDPGYPSHSPDEVQGNNYINIGNVGAGTLAVAMPNPRAWFFYTNLAYANGVVAYEAVHIDANNNVFISLAPWTTFLDQYPGDGWAHQSRSEVMVADVSNLPTTYNPLTPIKAQRRKKKK